MSLGPSPSTLSLSTEDGLPHSPPNSSPFINRSASAPSPLFSFWLKERGKRRVRERDTHEESKRTVRNLSLLYLAFFLFVSLSISLFLYISLKISLSSLSSFYHALFSSTWYFLDLFWFLWSLELFAAFFSLPLLFFPEPNLIQN